MLRLLACGEIFRVDDHGIEHLPGLFAGVDQFRVTSAREIAAIRGEIEPDPGFGRFGVCICQPIDERLDLSALSEVFGDICGDPSRRAPNLIRQ